MKKFTFKISTTFLLIFAIGIQPAFAAFSDVSTSNKYYEAISYLEENGVLNGYPDGTFKPTISVNRAEFLKIILEGSDIALDVTTNTIFPDVDHNAWYAPYIKKAYAEGWVNGYPDGTFKPEQTINKVEALKILGEVQNWELTNPTQAPFTDTPTSEWYAKYVAYAKTHNYLEETGSTFSPGNLMQRGGISEIIYRTLTETEIIDPEDPEDPIDPNDPEGQAQEEPEFKTIATNFFTNVTLSETLPNNFYKNEVYVVSGTVSGNYDTATVLLDPYDSDPNNYVTFTAEVENNSFEIPVFFNDSGYFAIGLLPGDQGTTKLHPVNVISQLPVTFDSSTAKAPTNTSIGFNNDTTSVNFNAENNTLKKFTFTQGSDSVTYYSRQNRNNIPLQYKKFEDFNEGSVSYTVSNATLSSQKPLQITSNFIASSSKNFTAMEHSFDDISEDEITANPPDLLNSVQAISFSGTVHTETQLMVYITKPNGFLDTKDMTTNDPTSTSFGQIILQEGGDFSFSYTPNGAGRYIVEINDQDGIPILNHPVYVGGGIPLIPDFFDLNERAFPNNTQGTTEMRNQMLNLINQSREDHDLDPVSLDSDLNALAQAHAQDMATKEYFAHVNLEGKSPDARRIAAGITTPVSENIARDISITFAHWGLMRSGAHRDNILTDNWTMVGIGVAKDANGYLLIAEEFSQGAFSESDLQAMENELASEINDLRDSNNRDELTAKTALQNVGIYINDKMIDEDATLNQDLFSEALDANDIGGFSEALGRTYSAWDEIFNSLISEDTLLDADWKSYGVDVQLDNVGILHAILILNTL